jgi:hypothetical protein
LQRKARRKRRAFLFVSDDTIAEGGVKNRSPRLQAWDQRRFGFVSPLQRAKESFLSAAKAGSQLNAIY